MFAIIGAAGNVGFSTSSALRATGAAVRAILHDATKSTRLTAIGCDVAVADIQDSDALAQAIAGADAVQIIVPLRPTVADPAADMRQSIDSIITALDRARPQRILAISDYGAHIAGDIGMPSLFHGLEARLRALGGDLTILRSAEHIHNWARGIPAAIESGSLPGFHDAADMPQPMIAAQDLGRIAADLLLRAPRGHGIKIVHAEGPHRHSAQDIADALSSLSGRQIQAVGVPRDHWERAFSQLPASLADLVSKANDAKNKGRLVDVEAHVGEVSYGTTGLIEALRLLLA